VSQPISEPAPSAPALYGGYLRVQLAEQDARKASFEQRGLSVVTTSGALATLLFGLAAFTATKKSHDHLPHDARLALVVALILFVVAGILALLTNLPVAYEVPSAEMILNLAERDPPHTDVEAQRELAKVYARIVKDAKQKNGQKGWLLFGALLFEVGAILAVAVAVALVVI
jgi:hypothetical protein